MILLHDIIQILRLPNNDGGLVTPVIALDSGSVAATPINGDLFGDSLVANRLA